MAALLANLIAGCATSGVRSGRDGPLLRPPSINFSPAGATRYALEQGCVPHLRDGTPVLATLRPFVFADRNARVLPISSQVSLESELNGACTIRAKNGDRDVLRTTLLEALTKAGLRPRALQDSGPGSRDSIGDFRQELHCLTIVDRPGYLVLSTSTERRRPKLQATLGLDAAGPCGEAAR